MHEHSNVLHIVPGRVQERALPRANLSANRRVWELSADRARKRVKRAFNVLRVRPSLFLSVPSSLSPLLSPAAISAARVA